MLDLTNLIGFGAGFSRGNTAYGLTDTAFNNTNQTTYTFSDLYIGPDDDPERWAFVVSTNQATANNSAGATWALTIGGVAATQITRQDNGSQVIYVHALKVPAGETATIQAVHSTAGRGFAVAVYVVYGNVDITPVDIQHIVSTTLSDTIATVDGGWVLAAVSTNTSTPANFTGLTTDFSQIVGTSNQCVAFGSAFDVSGTSLAYSHAFAGTSECMTGISFKWI